MEDGASRRRSPRAKLLMAASLEHDGATRPVKLRNLSAEGALVEGADCPPVGSTVVFRKNEMAMSGRIAWAKDGRAGIAFDARLDPDSLLRPMPAPRPLRDEIHKRPGVRPRPAPQERQPPPRDGRRSPLTRG